MKKRKKRITVPVIMQMEALECGTASLAMILAYYGKWLPLEQVRSDCGVSRDGTKASSIAKAGRSYGLEVKAHRYGVDEVKRMLLILQLSIGTLIILLCYAVLPKM